MEAPVNDTNLAMLDFSSLLDLNYFEDLIRMQGADEHRCVKETITTWHNEQAIVHRVVENSFETLCKYQM